MRWPRRAALLIAAALVGAGCTSGRVVSGHILSAASTPLATTVDTDSGVWAVVPMGQLSDPANTYWQLLYRPNGSNQWVDHVDALATATTGGVNVGSGGASLLAGVEATENLTFSPVIETTDSATSWHNGLLPAALTRMPQALAIGPSGQAAAIVGPAGPHQRLVTGSASNLTSWRDAPGRSCEGGSLNAVRWSGQQFLVGATCHQPGMAGVFELSTGKSVGPTLPATDGPVPVVALGGGSTTVSALLVVQGNWVVASSPAGSTDWTESNPLTIDPSAIKSIVAEDDGGFLLLSDSFLAEYQPGGKWIQLPAPPPGTATIAHESGGRLSALVAGGTSLVDWELGPSGHWVQSTTLQVPILYGASG